MPTRAMRGTSLQVRMTPGRNAAQAGWRWTLLAAAVGLLSSILLSTVLRLPRGLFVACWTITASAFLVWYVVSQNIDLRLQLQRRWVAGLVVGVMFGALLARQVLGQPGSIRATGLTLAGELLAFGLVYGVVDALMLSVVPVLSLYGMRQAAELRDPTARYKWALVSLLGSAIVSAAYHAGFAEFRGLPLMQPVIGNVLMTLSYLLTGSPLAPIVSHVLMHVAAVMHGMATTAQLPPHY